MLDQGVGGSGDPGRRQVKEGKALGVVLVSPMGAGELFFDAGLLFEQPVRGGVEVIRGDRAEVGTQGAVGEPESGWRVWKWVCRCGR